VGCTGVRGKIEVNYRWAQKLTATGFSTVVNYRYSLLPSCGYSFLAKVLLP